MPYKNLMAELKEKGKYEITEEMKKRLDILYGDFSDEDDTLKAIEKSMKVLIIL